MISVKNRLIILSLYQMNYVNELQLYRESFKLGCMLDHSVYDMIYLVLARRNNATLLTMDQRLVASAEKAGVNTV